MPRNVDFGFREARGGAFSRGTFGGGGVGGQFGGGISRYFAELRYGALRSREDFRDFLIDMWVEVVLGTAWEAPPAPAESIIAEKQSKNGVRLGWDNFKGSKQRALARFKVRQEIMNKIVSDIMNDPRFSFGLGDPVKQRQVLDEARRAYGIGSFSQESSQEERAASLKGTRSGYAALQKMGSRRSFGR